MKHLSLICFFGKCSFLLEYGWIGVKSWTVPFLSSHPWNVFLSSIFHLFQSFYLIIIYLPWWKIAFSARLSSTLIFHLPPSAIAWKSFLIPSYSEVYFLFLVSFPLKKHFHILACLFENALPFFRKSFVVCRLGYSLPPPSAPFPVRYSLSPAFLNRRRLPFTLSSRLSFRRRFPSSMVCPKHTLPWRCLYVRPPVTLNAGSIYQPG